MDDRTGELNSDYCEHILVLSDKSTGRELARGSLYNYLMRNADIIDVTKQEAFLPISLEFNDLEVTIKVPDWYIQDVTPGWE